MTDLVAAALGVGAGRLLAGRALARPPAWSLRTNVSGREVPAVLGLPVAAGGIVALAVLLAGEAAGVEPARTARVAVAAALVLALMAAAGWWDDRRGDESARGFAGHLGAARGGRLTGGLVKIAGGGAAGVAAAALVYPSSLAPAALTALAVPLAANLFNLLDRAPGRAGKAALVAALPLLVFAPVAWAVAAGGTFGTLAGVLPADLRERGMLGDAGANPMGALLGLGLAVTLGTAGLAVAVVVMLALNLASERWSFSQVIERSPPLRWFDSIGRK
ncbi:MAG TPA: hypothetical protein VG318_03770 [Actinomycetota bacterium]|nr:hypothetical protein [Actinomycetota bacterium]